MQFMRMCWYLTKEERYNITLLFSEYLHFPYSACQHMFCRHSLRVLVSHSPSTVAHLSPLSELLECKMETWGWSHYSSHLLPSSFLLSASVFFFLYAAISAAVWFVPVSIVFPYALSSNISFSVSSVLPCRLPTTGKQCCSIPGELIKVRSRSNTLWHILIEKKKKMFTPQISNQQQRQPSHHHHPLLEPGWPPAKINDPLLVSSSKR